ncbi:MAG: hypothetical protein QW469_03270, partial [Candidatus Aenigmatarchaeota archaeon]
LLHKKNNPSIAQIYLSLFYIKKLSEIKRKNEVINETYKKEFDNTKGTLYNSSFSIYNLFLE